MKSKTVKKSIIKCFAIFCLVVQIICVFLKNPLTCSYILNCDSLSDSIAFHIVNYQKDYYALTPNKSFFSSEEERVLYAIQNNETDFLSERELKLYERVKFFQEQHINQIDVEKVFSAVVMTCYLCKYDINAEERSTAYSALVEKNPYVPDMHELFSYC